ncbi:hypothetical protein KGQ19_20445 [Catenulispora sp. NL8]|uniref:Abortive infection protein n=1 Tax=Catenulispora pinistramenti TaxID=2705254 RepID=A0ABS5KT69_9ACTN|nr:hypothetical protein [Catenulispora pinistramenti]MBS2549237.1 hypothetical protein [Catenulispora pinistramenti]
MRAFGVTYDTGFTSAGTTNHEPFLPDIVQREMRVIREVLHCDAVRITGGVADRLEIAARAAAEAGLEVWYAPFTNGLTQDELLTFLLDAAERAERLRAAGARVVFLTGSEISLFTDGFLPGADFQERAAVLGDPARFRALLPQLNADLNAFLARVLAGVRARFRGRVGYCSVAFEMVDWTPFDLIASDAGYRNATNEAAFADTLRAQVAQGKPFAVTEFGCGAFRGAAAVAGREDAVAEWGEDGRPVRMAEGKIRDEQEQAAYLREMLGLYDEGGVEAAFVYTFARWDEQTLGDRENEPERDFDIASFGIVRVLPPGVAEGDYAELGWEPKAAFGAVAEFGAARAARAAEAAEAAGVG